MQVKKWAENGRECLYAMLFSGVSGVSCISVILGNFAHSGISGFLFILSVKPRVFPFLSSKNHVARLQRIPCLFIQLTPS